MHHSKLGFNVNGTGTLVPPDNPFVPQLLGMAAQVGHFPAPDLIYLPTLCNLTMAEFAVRDSDLSLLVPAWHVTTSAFIMFLDPCARAAPRRDVHEKYKKNIFYPIRVECGRS